jgi:hypothetical protein
MKRIALLGIAICAVWALAYAETWRTFAPPEGRFSVDMPGRPRQAKQKVEANSEIVGLTIYLAESKGEAFAVTYADHDRFDDDREAIDRILDGARDGAVRNSGGKLMSEERVVCCGCPGRAIVFKTESGRLVRELIVLSKDRLYQVYVLSDKSAQSEDSARFFKSFKLRN